MQRSDLADSLAARLAALVGPAHVLTEPEAQRPYVTEWRDLYVGRAAAVVRPGSTEEVAAVVRLAAERRIPIVPQGGNTGLVGGQVPDATGNEIVLSLGRLDRIRAVDAAGDTMIAEAGVVLADAQAAAAAVDRLFPLSLGSERSATIGGNLSTNAGGLAVLAYGTMRDLALGLEVVLPSGEIWQGLRTLRKDNTGYNLKQLFIGAEGTLGIITAAAVKLFPRPRGRAVALAGVAAPEAALALLGEARRIAGPALTSFELLPRLGLAFALRHLAGARDPLAAPHPWYVLLEVSSGRSAAEAQALVEAILAAGRGAGTVADAALAGSAEQAAALWRMRQAMSEVQKPEGGSIKHDVSVPVAAVPAFIAEATAAVEALVPGCRPVPFGHLGDGNIHFNVSQPEGADKAAYLAGWGAMNAVVHAVVAKYGGSIAAEHGIGRLKRDLLPGVKPPVEMALMRTVKAALDPLGIMNPGKVV